MGRRRNVKDGSGWHGASDGRYGGERDGEVVVEGGSESGRMLSFLFVLLVEVKRMRFY